jgi:hypothetical protein
MEFIDGHGILIVAKIAEFSVELQSMNNNIDYQSEMPE